MTIWTPTAAQPMNDTGSGAIRYRAVSPGHPGITQVTIEPYAQGYCGPHGTTYVVDATDEVFSTVAAAQKASRLPKLDTGMTVRTLDGHAGPITGRRDGKWLVATTIGARMYEPSELRPRA